MFQYCNINFSDGECKKAGYLLEKFKQQPIIFTTLCKKIKKKFNKKLIKLKKCRPTLNSFAILSIISTKIIPTCLCGKYEIEEFYPNSTKVYPKSCNNKDTCTKYIKIIVKKKNKTNLKKYGVKNAANSEIVKKKIKNTNLKKYGVPNAMQSEKIKNRLKKTMLKKYGVEHALQSKEIRKRMRKKSIKNWGVDSPLKSKLVQSKIKKTNLKKYGVENPFQANSVKKKIKETLLKNHGVEHNSYNPITRSKRRKTTLKNHGVECSFQSKEIMKKARKTNLKKYGDSIPCRTKKIKNKIARTNLKKYGHKNPFGSKIIQKKIKKSMLKKYGVEHALQHPKFFKKFQKSAHKYKKVRLGNRIVRVQGYEKIALKYLLKKGYKPNDIKVSMEDKEVPIIKYKYKGKKSIYYPDFLIESINTIIEVKSTFTLYHNRSLFYKSQKKAKKCIKLGYNFKLLLVHDNIIYILSKKWLHLEYNQLYLLKCLKNLKTELKYIKT